MSTLLPSSPLVRVATGSEPPANGAFNFFATSETQSWQSFDAHEKWKGFSQKSEDGHWISHVKVQGMHCSACAGKVEQTLRDVPGVISAQVDALSSRAKIVWAETEVKPSQWLAAVASAGYSLLPIYGTDAFELARLARRTMLWRWLVAGFCMMQVMMYAWPNYGALPGDIDATSDQLLRWASLLLTLPVIVFSCRPFFSSAWNDLKHGRVSMDLPVALGIGLTFAVSTAAVLDPQGIWGAELYFDSLTMLVFFLLTGRWLELNLKQKVAGQLELGADLLPVTAQLICGEENYKTVPVQSLKQGDVIQVRTGESFAADGIILQGQSDAEESVLTGEAMPVAKVAGDSVYAGSTNLTSPVHVKVTKVGQETRFGQMNQLIQASLHTKPQIVQLADRVAKPFLMIVLILAGAALLYWWPSDPQRAVLAAIAVLVVTCPCALALAAPAAFLSSASALAKSGLLVRDLSALERLEKVNHFVFDKTGTLTQSVLTVLSIAPSEGYTKEQVMTVAGELTRHSMHSVSQAVYRYVSQTGLNPSSLIVSAIQEHAGLGIQAIIRSGNGMPATYKLGSARFCGLTADTQGMSQRSVYLSCERTLMATFYLSESLRPDAGLTISQLKHDLSAHHSSKMSYVSLMSGDSASSIKAIAVQLNWNHERDQIRAECSAEDKLIGLQELQSQGYCVAMVGDGINDGPVLAAAQVSFAPAQGAALASVKADFLLTSASLAPIALANSKARATMRIVKQNLAWALLYNMGSVPLALIGMLTPWMAGLGMALSSLLVLINSLRLQRIGQ